VRKPIYQLYPLLNHVCTFGQEYVKPLMTILDRVSPLV
jgi:fructosamine-3-kinase